MAKEEWYHQCRFISNRGKLETAWIPEHGAKVGKRLYFDGDETEIWTVQKVYERQPGSYLQKHQMDYKHQRKMSDV